MMVITMTEGITEAGDSLKLIQPDYAPPMNRWGILLSAGNGWPPLPVVSITPKRYQDNRRTTDDQ
jgi:hypothetical protein